MTKTYRQCRLERRTPTGTVETVTHLPSMFAKVGKVVDIKESDGSWSENWRVTLAGSLVEEPRDPRELIKGHRKMTGDSTPKKGS